MLKYVALPFLFCEGVPWKKIFKTAENVLSPVSGANAADKRDFATVILQGALPESCLDQALYVGEIGRDEDDYAYVPKCASISQEGMTCFPQGARVWSGKEYVRIEDLNIGQTIASSATESTEVVGWLHRTVHSERAVTWVDVTLASNQTVTATENHITFAALLREDSDDLVAVTLPVGSLTADGRYALKLSDDSWSTVVSISRRVANLGLYAPLTRSGQLVVEGVQMSSFAALSSEEDVALGAVLGAQAHSGLEAHEYILKYRGGMALIGVLDWARSAKWRRWLVNGSLALGERLLQWVTN